MTDIGTWLRERLPGEDLDRPRLAALATELGRERGLWESLVRHDPDERYFTQLYRDVHLDVWLICWLNQQDTGFHDHSSRLELPAGIERDELGRCAIFEHERAEQGGGRGGERHAEHPVA